MVYTYGVGRFYSSITGRPISSLSFLTLSLIDVEQRRSYPLAVAQHEAFEPTEAKRLAEGLEVHHTPKHGSWLNMAKTELGVLSRQCLDRRTPDQHTLQDAVALWQFNRNQAQMSVDWRFTTADARIKLKRLYPSIHEGYLTSAVSRNQGALQTPQNPFPPCGGGILGWG